MLYPSEVMNIAEDLASRIPIDNEYVHERNNSWLAIGQAYLTINDFQSAYRALSFLNDPHLQARLRFSAAQWSGDHPESISASELLRDTVEQIDIWEDALSRRDLTDLVKPAFRILGQDHIYLLARKLKDPFSASNVLVSLAGYFQDPDRRRETLVMAEELAISVGPGNRDYALRWVVSGYKHSGFEEDEKRVRALMSQDLDFMNASEASMFARAENLLRPIDPPTADTPLLKLLRFLDYGYNDLRVLFLTEVCEAGGLNDPEAEQLVVSATFRQITPAHPPSIYSDPSLLNVDDLARFLFGRPRRQHDSDRRYIDGTGDLTIADLQRFIQTLQELFEHFGEIARRFSQDQVDAGLWYLFGEPFWLGTLVTSEDLPAPIVYALTRAMIHPFHDYYCKVSGEYAGTAFFMWWHNFSSGGQDAILDAAALEVLPQILVLPNRDCRDAAMHGLNHLYPNPLAATIIRKYLDDNRKSLSDAEIETAELSMAGALR